MKYGVLHYGGMVRLLLFVASLSMANANALVLGDDIQVDSALGHPLEAHVPILELSEADAQQFKVHLATIQDYKNLGLIYPESQKFRFELVSEPGKQSYIRVTTQRPVSDPFIDLLVETTSSGGKLEKSYTILLDPAPNLPKEAPVDSRQVTQPVESPVAKPAASIPNPTPSKAKTSHGLHGRHHREVVAAREVQDDHRQLKLSMSLSISRYAPSASPSTSNDALQEELVAKEKLLDDLKLQIGEMQLVIKDLKEKQAGKIVAASGIVNAVAASSVAVSGVASGVPAAVSTSAAASRVVAVSAPRPSEAMKLKAVSKPADEWKKPVFTLAPLLAVVSVLFWFRRRMERGSSGLFDDLPGDEASMPDAESVHGDVRQVSMRQPVEIKSSKSEKIVQPASEQKGPSVPPEYAALMEANKHLRAGNEELAEEALLRAIRINPNNAYGYLALLKLYEKRSDKSSFEKIAKQLQSMGDAESFNEAVMMGRSLDPDNPLYAAES